MSLEMVIAMGLVSRVSNYKLVNILCCLLPELNRCFLFVISSGSCVVSPWDIFTDKVSGRLSACCRRLLVPQRG